MPAQVAEPFHELQPGGFGKTHKVLGTDVDPAFIPGVLTPRRGACMNAGQEDPVRRQDSSHFLKVVPGIIFEEMCEDRRRAGEIDRPIGDGKDYFRLRSFPAGL